MANRKRSVFRTELNLCGRNYNIVDSVGKVVFCELNISLMTDDGFFAAPIPPDTTYDKFKNFEGYELHELPYDTEDTFSAGKIEKCTPNGFYGRFYKDCIHRAKSKREHCFNARSARWIKLCKAGIVTKKLEINKGEIINFPNKEKRFDVRRIKTDTPDILGAIVTIGWYIVGVIINIDKTDDDILHCISAEVLLREMCQHKENIENAIANDKLKNEPVPDFAIHSGILEKYYGKEEKVIIPEGVHTIGMRAFKHNNLIEYIQCPNSLKVIDTEAFCCCNLLKSVNFNNGLKIIGRAAFEHCTSLETAELPDEVQKIGSSAFMGCKRLKTLRLPKNLKKIEDATFMNCENIKEVVIPIGVKSIGNDAFGFCKQLTQLEIDMSVSAETSSFEVTPWLKKYIKENGVLILNNKIIKVSSKLTKYKIPDNVKEIGSFAFSKSNIEELYIPDNVKEIKSYAFCLSNIKKIRLPNNLTCIEEGTFSDCQNLEELVFPETVREIDCCALYNIPNCVVTILNKESNALMGDYSFEGYKEEKPYVKEVRAYSGSKAMEAAKLCNLNCTNLDDSIEKIT